MVVTLSIEDTLLVGCAKQSNRRSDSCILLCRFVLPVTWLVGRQIYYVILCSTKCAVKFCLERLSEKH